MDKHGNMEPLNRKPKSKSYIKCEHGIYEENCVKCFPEMLCEHNTRRNRCVQCNPRLLCPHDKSKYRCKVCAKPRYKRVENKDAFKKLPKGCDHCNNKANCYVCAQQPVPVPFTMKDVMLPPTFDDI